MLNFGVYFNLDLPLILFQLTSSVGSLWKTAGYPDFFLRNHSCGKELGTFDRESITEVKYHPQFNIDTPNKHIRQKHSFSNHFWYPFFKSLGCKSWKNKHSGLFLSFRVFYFSWQPLGPRDYKLNFQWITCKIPRSTQRSCLGIRLT